MGDPDSPTHGVVTGNKSQRYSQKPIFGKKGEYRLFPRPEVVQYGAMKSGVYTRISVGSSQEGLV